MIPYIIFFILIGITLFLISVSLFNSEPIINYFAACIIIIFGLYVYINGISELNNWFTRGFGFTLLFLGLYITLANSLSMLEVFD